jgi:diguanylate cyclase (GGDEF)-like protein
VSLDEVGPAAHGILFLMTTNSVRAHDALPADAAAEDDGTSDQTSDLEWLLEICPPTSNTQASDVNLSQPIIAAVERLECALGALLVPEKRLTLARTASGGMLSPSDSLRRLEKPILNWARRTARPLIVNTPALKTAAQGGLKILAVPVSSHVKRAGGVLVLLRAAHGPDFMRRELALGQHLARHLGALLETQFDTATGLYTRHALQEQIKEWPISTPSDVHYILCVDIDRLHVINETLGASAGDQFIACVARLLEPARLPGGALACRLSGGRFAVALPATTVEAATALGQALQHSATKETQRLVGEKVVVSLSCGISRFSNTLKEVAQALVLAELACKAAKDHGRGRIELYDDSDPSMTCRFTDALMLGKLQEALRTESLTLFAQKILPLQRPGDPAGYEILLRSLDGAHDNRAPQDLFSTAHRYQMESAIDAWVIEHALAEAARYRSELLSGHVSLSINITAQSLSDEGLLKRIRGWIGASRLAPALLLFEITESAAFSSLTQAQKFIQELRTMGCRFALDDFGTGVNSLKYLNSLAVNRVKIDGSFVADLLTNSRSAATVRAIVGLARDLGVETVAEYAENTAILEQLQAMGVDYAQGYGVELPRPLSEILTALRAEQSAALHKLQLEL